MPPARVRPKAARRARPQHSSKGKAFDFQCRYARQMLSGARKERELDLERMLAEAQARIIHLEAELRGKAERDSVTGLATLDRFRTALELESGRARRHGRELAVALVDVDDFRALMARHGHVAGDDVLREVARVLEPEPRPTDPA